MIGYYFFTLFVTTLAVVGRRVALSVIVFVVALFLLLLPSTGLDYDYYKEAYDEAQFVGQFPWFTTPAALTAEPAYLWYTSLLGVVLPVGFKGFLVFNFFVCFLVSCVFLRQLRAPYLECFWVAFLPVVVPTIFYFSPRSSLSFFMVLSGLFLLCRRRFFAALAFFFVGISMHSQYLPVVAFLLVSYVSYRCPGKCFAANRTYLLVFMASVFGVFLANLSSVLSIVMALLGVLPSSGVALAKLHYFESAQRGFRLTSLVSILVNPLLLWLLSLKKEEGYKIFSLDGDFDKFLFHMMSAVVLFGFVVNVVYFNFPHVSGRLSRFSDYLCMGLLFPAFFISYANRFAGLFVFFLFAAIAPALYATLYC